MKIAVCEDEKHMREWMGEKICRDYSDAEVLFYESGEALLAADEQLEILFLDIRMAGRNGMEIARELRKKQKDTVLIFVTAWEEYVFEAFDVGAFHYLVKPFSAEKFGEVLEKAVAQVCAQNTKESKKEEKYLFIRNHGVHMKVLLDSIIYAEVFNRKVVLHQSDGDIVYYGKLSALEKLAGEDFFRSHRAYLVNFRYVEKYDASTIYLEEGTALMAKQKFPEFVKKYMKYNRRKA